MESGPHGGLKKRSIGQAHGRSGNRKVQVRIPGPEPNLISISGRAPELMPDLTATCQQLTATPYECHCKPGVLRCHAAPGPYVEIRNAAGERVDQYAYAIDSVLPDRKSTRLNSSHA